MNEYEIKTAEIDQRLDKVLSQILGQTSRQTIQTWIKSGQVLVNGLNKKPNYRCRINDRITWKIDPEQTERTVDAENIDLDIVFEDEDIIVINKPIGMIVHPTLQKTTGTLVNALLNYSKHLSDISGEERPGIVHRLDQDTSGLMIVAKNNQAHLNLKEQFQNQSIKRYYHTIVVGNVPHEHGVIQAPIGRNPKVRTQMAVVKNGKPAETHFTVLQQLKGYTYMECELKTGRTHQIRVHLKYMGYPILGDKVYGRKKHNLMDSQALFAKKIVFSHPKTEKAMTFEISAPIDFNRALKKISD